MKTSCTTNIAFCYCGQGGQEDQMGVDLYHSSTTFRSFLERLDKGYSTHSGVSILDLSKIEEKCIDDSVLLDSGRSMVLSTFIQLGLVYLLKKANIVPRYTLGHSNGEFVAMYSRLDLDDDLCLRHSQAKPDSIRLITGIIYIRYTLMKDIVPGEMMVAKTSEEEMNQLIAEANAEVWVSAINTSCAVTVSGKSPSVEQLYVHCKNKGVKVSRLAMVKYPFHSPWMNDYATHFDEEAQKYFNAIVPIQPILHCSSVDGSMFDTFPDCYWKQNITQPVQFLRACQSLTAFRPDIVLEISPTPVLHNFLKTNMSNIPNVWVRCVQDASCKTLDASFVSAIVDMANKFDEIKSRVNWKFLTDEFRSTKCHELLTSLNKN